MVLVFPDAPVYLTDVTVAVVDEDLPVVFLVFIIAKFVKLLISIDLVTFMNRSSDSVNLYESRIDSVTLYESRLIQ